MAEGYGTFGREVKTSGKLHEMLSLSSLTPEKLFEVPNIAGDINQNIQTFLRFCLKKRDFTTKMLKICFNSTYHELQSDDVKKVAQSTIQVLTNDQNALGSFLFGPYEDNWGITVQEKIQQQTTPSIESEAERLFSQAPTKIQVAAWEKEKDVFEQYQLIKMTLAHLEQQHKNYTCLGFIHKLYESVMKKSSDQFLQFLQRQPQYLTLLLQNMNYISIGATVVLLLTCEDRTSKYKYEGLKQKLFQKIIDYSFQNIQSPENFDTYMGVIEEILNTTKQSYYQYFEDFKRCANVLVSEPTLRKYYEVLHKSEIAFGNASRYLQHIIKRINSESEQHDYYRQSHNAEPTMNFQHTFFYSEFGGLLDLIGKSQSYSSMNRVNYLGFLISLLKNMQNHGIEPNMPSAEIFRKLIHLYQQQKGKPNGLVKNYIFQLLKVISKKLKESELSQVAAWLIESKVQQELLSKLFDNVSLSPNSTNSNPNVCFIMSILFQIQNKQNAFLSNYAKANNVHLQGAYQKYRTKLANYGQEDENASPVCEDGDIINFRMATKGIDAFLGSGFEKHTEDKQKDKAVEKEEKQPEIHVGKNSVVIPVLNLPNKAENSKVPIEEAQVEQVKSSSQLSRQALIKDLKSTKIELPQRLKVRKGQQEQKKGQTKKQAGVQSLQQQQKIVNKILPVSQAKCEPQETPTIPKQVPPHGTLTGEQKYFVRHFLLF